MVRGLVLLRRPQTMPRRCPQLIRRQKQSQPRQRGGSSRRRSASPKRGKGVLGKIHARLNTNKSPEASLELADLLLQLIDEELSGLAAVKLKPQMVNRVLSAGMKHGSNPEFVGRLDSIMKGLEAIARMDSSKNSSSKGNSSSSLPYDARTYSIVAELWGRSGIANSQHQVQRIIKTLARSRLTDAPTECERILKMMEERNAELTTACFNACLDAWAKSGRSDAPRKAEDLLVSMQQQGIQPNFISFTTVIDCFAKSRDVNAAHKAEDILRLMQELDDSGMPGVRPTTVTFNAAINAYSKGPNRLEFAENADRLLQEMKVLSDADDVKVSPDRITYTACINAYSKVKMNRAAVRAVELLREMEKLYKEGGNDAVSPDLYTYNAVLRTLGNQDEGYHANEAEYILNEMISLHEQGHRRIKPDILSFNSVIRSCILHTKRSAKDKQQALKIAITTLARIRSDGGEFGLKADSFTFSYFFKACAALASAKQLEELLKASFKWCCNSGSVNDRVLDALKRSASPELAQKLLGTSKEVVKSVVVDDLPAEWSRLARSNKR